MVNDWLQTPGKGEGKESISTPHLVPSPPTFQRWLCLWLLPDSAAAENCTLLTKELRVECNNHYIIEPYAIRRSICFSLCNLW